MKLRSLLMIAIVTLGFGPIAHAELPVSQDEWILLHALGDALKAANFYDCRVELNDMEISILHGRVYQSLSLSERRTQVTVLNDVVSVVGYDSGYQNGDLSWYQNQIDFLLSKDQKAIAAVRFFRSRYDHINVGSVTHPVYKQVITPINKINCKAD